MGDKDPMRGKGKEKVLADDEEEIALMARELSAPNDSSWDGNSPAGAPGTGSGAGNLGQDAPRSTPVVNLPHGHQQPGGSSFLGDHGVQFQPMGFLQQCPPPSQLQPRDALQQTRVFSAKAWEWGGRMAARIMEGMPRKLQFPALPPPQPHHQRPPPVGAGVQQLQNQPAVATGPAGQLGEALGGYAAQFGHPVPPADQPVPGPGPSLKCSACSDYPVPTKDQPREHTCVCGSCRSMGIICVVCDFGL